MINTNILVKKNTYQFLLWFLIFCHQGEGRGSPWGWVAMSLISGQGSSNFEPGELGHVCAPRFLLLCDGNFIFFSLGLLENPNKVRATKTLSNVRKMLQK